MSNNKIKKCCLCGKEIEGYGNNPSPLKGDICCDECNATILVPLRLYLYQQIYAEHQAHEQECVEISDEMN